MFKYKGSPVPLIFDLRTTQEIKTGRLPNSIHVATPLPPLDQADRKVLFYKLRMHLRGYPKHYPIYVYCKKGIRSKIGYEYIRWLGFYNVTNLGGVMEDPLLGYFRRAQFVRGPNSIWDYVPNSQLKKYQPDSKGVRWIPI